MDNQVPPPVVLPRPIDQGPIPAVVSENDMKRQLWLSYNQGYNEGFSRGYNTAVRKCSTKPPRSPPRAPISSKYALHGKGDFVQRNKKPHYNHFANKQRKPENNKANTDTNDMNEYPPLNVVFNKNAVNAPPGFQDTVWTKPSLDDKTQQW